MTELGCQLGLEADTRFGNADALVHYNIPTCRHLAVHFYNFSFLLKSNCKMFPVKK